MEAAYALCPIGNRFGTLVYYEPGSSDRIYPEDYNFEDFEIEDMLGSEAMEEVGFVFGKTDKKPVKPRFRSTTTRPAPPSPESLRRSTTGPSLTATA